MSYSEIYKHYETCLEKHGDCHLGVDWPNQEGADVRYQVMLDLMFDDGDLLDFGCGCSALLDYILRTKRTVRYHGCDISEKFIKLSRSKHPETAYYLLDLLHEPLPRDFDYIVCNGVFTEKLSMEQDEMWPFFGDMLQRLWPHVNKGLAFNTMSKNVDWERADLFHVYIPELESFLSKHLSRHYVFRNDYGLYEFTTYVYKAPRITLAGTP